MEKQTVLQVFEALSSGVRLDVFRLLVQAGRQGLVAGEIASTLDLPATNLSFHLKTLIHSRLATVEQEGRFQRYRANIPLMLETIAYLTENCCADHPEECLELRQCQPGLSALLPPATKCGAETLPADNSANAAAQAQATTEHTTPHTTDELPARQAPKPF